MDGLCGQAHMRQRRYLYKKLVTRPHEKRKLEHCDITRKMDLRENCRLGKYEINLTDSEEKREWREFCGDCFQIMYNFVLTYGAEPFLRSCQSCSHSEENSQKF
jgi:hypothetical protein